MIPVTHDADGETDAQRAERCRYGRRPPREGRFLGKRGRGRSLLETGSRLSWAVDEVER